MQEYEYNIGCRNVLMIVDDMELNRVILSETFKNDYLIKEFENGSLALEYLKNNLLTTAAVLLDVVMPVMDGFEFLEQMHKLGFSDKVPVFLITADCSEEKMRRGFELGVMDIIEKPVIPYFISRRVNSVVELFRARESLSEVVGCQERELEAKSIEIQELNYSIIETLSTAIEFRSNESGEHVRRIHDLTQILLTDLRNSGVQGCNYSDEQISQIATAAVMHDVGKISIPDNILNKPGKLTDEEFEIMKTHTIRGCEMLEKIPQSKNNPIYHYAYDICRHHHERWNGKGYPDGLKGDEISIPAQVVSLADVYDALTNERVYKPAFTHEQAVNMILNGECGEFNPVLLESFKNQQLKIKN